MVIIGKPSLRQQAYANIHKWIVSGHFPKGTVTSEVELSKMLDMSRTPVRAALQQLELEGYIRIAPKHGVIILDSSSQRVSDLLEIIISMVLFSVSASWHSNREVLLINAHSLSEDFNRLMTNKDDVQALINYEWVLLRDLILLCNNVEMTTTFQTATSRLFWNLNYRRWQAPCTGETSQHLHALIQSLSSDIEAFREALLHYLQTLKRTWQ
jgi:DNA-binding GntR family transcriptional regulator